MKIGTASALVDLASTLSLMQKQRKYDKRSLVYSNSYKLAIVANYRPKTHTELAEVNSFDSRPAGYLTSRFGNTPFAEEILPSQRKFFLCERNASFP